MEDDQYTIGASCRRTQVKGTDELPQLASLKTAHSADRDTVFALDPSRDAWQEPGWPDWTSPNKPGAKNLGMASLPANKHPCTSLDDLLGMP